MSAYPSPDPDASPSESRAGESNGNEDSWLSWLRAGLGRRSASSLRASLTDVLARAEIDEEVFSAEERAMLRNILGLREKRVDDVMVPRADIVAVDEATPIGKALETFREAGHSRLPIFRETLDDPVGIVHIKDLVAFLMSGAARKPEAEGNGVGEATASSFTRVDFAKPLSEARLSRSILFVPPSMPAIDLLVQMQSTRVHMALVIDEYGGTDGLVTIENLVEEVVGDIEDEHDLEEAPMVTEAVDGSFIADARADLVEVSEAIGVDLDLGEEAEEVDTLGGLIVTLAGRVPVRGELVAGPHDVEFEILDADPRRLKRIGVHRRAAPAQTAEAPAQDPAPEADDATAETDDARTDAPRSGAPRSGGPQTGGPSDDDAPEADERADLAKRAENG